MSEKLTFKEFYKKDPRKKAIERAFNTFNKKPLEHIHIPAFGSTSHIHKKIPFTDTFDNASPHRGNFSQIRPEHIKNFSSVVYKPGDEGEKEKDFRVRSKSPINKDRTNYVKTPVRAERLEMKETAFAETSER